MSEWIVKPIFDKDGFYTGYEKKGDLVRCKDCKHWGDTICNRFEEERIMWQNDFCSYGEERKE